MEEKRICPACGEESEAESNFCAACGASLPKREQNILSTEELESEKEQPMKEHREEAADRQGEITAQEPPTGVSETETTEPNAAVEGEEAEREKTAPPLGNAPPKSALLTDAALSNVRLAGIVGGALLALGVFLPIVRLPLVGGMSLTKVSDMLTLLLLVMGGGSVYLGLKGRYSDFLYGGISGLFGVVGPILYWWLKGSGKKGSGLEQQIAQLFSASLSWGAVVLSAGVLLLLGAGAVYRLFLHRCPISLSSGVGEIRQWLQEDVVIGSTRVKNFVIVGLLLLLLLYFAPV